LQALSLLYSINMNKVANILKDYNKKKIARKISPAKIAVIKRAVKRAVDEYGETYRLLATE